MNKLTPKIYRTTNWSTYNKALINRGNISIWFDSATQWYAPSIGKQGRNQIYSDAAIQCCLMIKSLFRLSLRMVTGFLQSLIKLCGLNWIAPDYTTLCRRQKHIISVIDKHADNGSLLITSQYETNIWLNHFEDQTVGEALLDRLVHRAHVFNLKGQSMRKRRGKQVLES